LDNPAGVFTLNYVPPTPESPEIADFLHLTIKRNVQAGKNINVTVKSWHPKKKQNFIGSSNVEGTSGNQSYVYHIPNLLQQHVEQHARAKANEHARHELTLETEVVGDPSVDIAMDLQLTGTNYFDQSYQMDHIHHEFGMTGHTMAITARAAKTGRSAS
jgi:hypothetical protein